MSLCIARKKTVKKLKDGCSEVGRFDKTFTRKLMVVQIFVFYELFYFFGDYNNTQNLIFIGIHNKSQKRYTYTNSFQTTLAVDDMCGEHYADLRGKWIRRTKFKFKFSLDFDSRICFREMHLTVHLPSYNRIDYLLYPILKDNYEFENHK